MGRYNSNKITSKFVKNYIKNRLWEKSNGEYVPFLNVRSVPTKGKANRIIGYKTGREHHVLSKLEAAVLCHFDWSDEVIDIKEQYPLLPMEVLQNIATEAGIDYPSFAGEPIIMTTDFLVTVKRKGKIIKYARTVKPSTDLSNDKINERLLAKFEIEKRFFKSKNIDWAIITEKDFSNVFVNNMEIVHSNKIIKHQTLLEKQYTCAMYTELADGIENDTSKDMPLAFTLTQLSKDLNINLSDVNEILIKAIASKIIVFDIYNKPLNMNALTISDITVNKELLSREVNMQYGGIL